MSSVCHHTAVATRATFLGRLFNTLSEGKQNRKLYDLHYDSMGVSECLLPKGPLIDELLVLPRTSLSRLPNASFTKTQINS